MLPCLWRRACPMPILLPLGLRPHHRSAVRKAAVWWLIMSASSTGGMDLEPAVCEIEHVLGSSRSWLSHQRGRLRILCAWFHGTDILAK
mmetsp:Transcript_8238/g.25650  ORF Transcript_8238/g.25650 Transcript_8238/m.25650 type:complete len:89 (-) Transcript_8238:788-1054(-)